MAAIPESTRSSVALRLLDHAERHWPQLQRVQVTSRAGFAYVTRHRANTLDRVPLAPRHGSEVRHIAGDPFDPVLPGPSSAAWGRRSGDYGRVAYVTTDGGTNAPPEGIIRKASLLRVELRPAWAGRCAD